MYIKVLHRFIDFLFLRHLFDNVLFYVFFPFIPLSPAKNIDIKQDSNRPAEAVGSQNLKGAATLKGKNCISSSQVSCWESCDSDDSSSHSDAEGAGDCERGRKSKKTLTDIEADVAYPEPRQPFPRTSSLTSHEQKTHVGYLISKKSRSPSQVPHLIQHFILRNLSPVVHIHFCLF